jgi:hypothetical protein
MCCGNDEARQNHQSCLPEGVIKKYDLDMIYVSGPGHGGPRRREDWVRPLEHHTSGISSQNDLGEVGRSSPHLGTRIILFGAIPTAVGSRRSHALQTVRGRSAAT